MYRKFLLIIGLVLLLGYSVFGQPENDECNNAFDISTAAIYGGVIELDLNLATPTFDHPIPNCWDFNAPDVWFKFTSPISSNPWGPNYVQWFFIDIENCFIPDPNTATLQPQVALYEGDCTGFSMLLCQTYDPEEPIGMSFNMSPQLDDLRTYWIRIAGFPEIPEAVGQLVFDHHTMCGPVYYTNNYNSPIYYCDQTTENPIITDNGGPDDPYSNNASDTLVLCPIDANPEDCLLFKLWPYHFGQGDTLILYEGTVQSGSEMAHFTGNNFFFTEIELNSSCASLRFVSDDQDVGPGFLARLSCLPPCTTNIGDHATENPLDISIFPNPFREMVRISIEEDSEILGVRVFDTSGQLVFEQQNPATELDLGHLGAGMYFLSVETFAGTIQRKLIRN